MDHSKRKWALLSVLLLVTIYAFAGTDAQETADVKGYGISDFFKLLGSLGLFLFGMKYMSEGIQKAAGSKLRQILRSVTSNRFFGIITGVFITTIIQSSSATTVMVVSFTNAGLFSLTESVSVIMGANVGTTVTGWIIALFGLKYSVAQIALPLLGLSFPLLFLGNDKVKNWAEFAIGFALLFFGLDELKHSVPDIEGNKEALAFISNWSDMGFWSILIFIGLGTILTIIIQSSSATMALTIIFLSEGWIGFPMAAAMVLGENIGTTITAQLASLMANLNAKRAAMAHTLFNVSGVIWMLILFWPFLHMVEWMVSGSFNFFCSTFNLTSLHDIPCGTDLGQIDLFNADKETLEKLGPIALALFHTTFNLINVVLLVWFVPLIVRIVSSLLKGQTGTGSDVLKYLDSGLMNTPELAVVEAQKEVLEFAKLTRKMYKANLIILYRDGSKKLKKAYKKVAEYEDECDEKEREMARYLAELSSKNLSKATATKVRRIWSIINDLERIGDLNEKVMFNLSREGQTEFPSETLKNIKTMTDKLDGAFSMLLNVLDKDQDIAYGLEEMQTLEKEINELRDNLRNGFFIEIENGSISFQTGLLAVEIISNLEKIADHIYSINVEMVSRN